MKFKRFELSNVAPKPDWWLVRPNEISTFCANVEKGDSSVIAITPGGFPVWSVIYNEFRKEPMQVNYSSATGAREMNYGPREGEPQTIMLIGGVHGCEIEGTVMLFNFMQLLETGRDLRGERMDDLLEMAKNYKFIFVPCVNMDGRAVSPDHRIGSDFDEARRANSGWMADGTITDWWTMKKYYPIPKEMIGYRGGYPNSEGFNINHDATPGYFRTREAEAVVRLAAEHGPDLFVNLHAQPAHEHNYISAPDAYSPRVFQKTVWELRRESDILLEKAGFKVNPIGEEDPEPRVFVNLNSPVTLAAGCPGLTIEFDARHSPSFERTLEAGYIFMRTFLEHGLKKPFVDRAELSGHKKKQ